MKPLGCLGWFAATVVASVAYWAAALVIMWLVGNCEIADQARCSERSDAGAMFMLAALLLYIALVSFAGVHALSRKRPLNR